MYVGRIQEGRNNLHIYRVHIFTYISMYVCMCVYLHILPLHWMQLLYFRMFQIAIKLFSNELCIKAALGNLQG